ncbi:hypothetical protein GF339_19765 [candidate division KSB3 bacterium]|uniref:Uncharacterized protein n=1 Tax=candidate division KSB3 bacterium TaxID=2044937 RepID=A0A9D5JZV2_9BACT|nr:hypothetical protein [candidate division KSB3 bacterium]MBD3326831.1 hypothetical protein [candidate division KSB3 bacterium]
MAMKCMPYEDVKSQMQAGDVIAFGGSSHFSGIIKMAIRAEVSHIGVILQAHVKDQATGELGHTIIDSTSRQGVLVSSLLDRVNEYDGDVWWLPLRRDLRETLFQAEAFYDFLCQQQGKRYDRHQAAGSAIDYFDRLPFGWRGPGYNPEDFERFFCSELVAAGLKAAGVVPLLLNSSEATPIDICRWKIYEPDYYLLKGKVLKEISGYNTLDPSQWE